MKNLSLPGSIIIAGIIIAGAIIFTNGGEPAVNKIAKQEVVQPTSKAPSVDSDIVLAPISEEDHIRGGADAPIKIVEFSDTECPFCQRFHSTMKKVVAEYGGQVAWVYRHFPLKTLHSKAPIEAQATECAAELGGNDAFWTYLDRIFEITPANNGLDPKKLPDIAEFADLNRADFEKCLASGKYEKKINDSVDAAVAAGGQGTPYSVIITPDGSRFPVSGAQPYKAMKQLIDAILKGVK